MCYPYHKLLKPRHESLTNNINRIWYSILSEEAVKSWMLQTQNTAGSVCAFERVTAAEWAADRLLINCLQPGLKIVCLVLCVWKRFNICVHWHCVCLLFSCLCVGVRAECRSDRRQVLNPANRVLEQPVKGERAPSICAMKTERKVPYIQYKTYFQSYLHLQLHLHWNDAAAAAWRTVSLL